MAFVLTVIGLLGTAYRVGDIRRGGPAEQRR